VNGESAEESGEGLRAADGGGRARVRVALLLAAAVVVWVLLQGMGIHERLPERIPVHFGPGGRPDGWAGKSYLSAFGLLIAAAGMLLLMAFVSRLSAKWYNFPGKERVLRLPPEQQAYVIAPMQEALAWLGAAIGVGFSLACRQTWQVALGERAGISAALMFVPLGVGLAGVVVSILVTRARLRSLEEPA